MWVILPQGVAVDNHSRKWARKEMSDTQHKNRRQRPKDLISAQEIATYAYCPEQWRLQYGLGLEPANRASLAAGDRHHARKAVAERVAGAAIMLGRAIVLLACLGLLLWWVLAR